MRNWSSKIRIYRYGIPVSLFLLAELLNHLVLHQVMRIPYEYMQLLDKGLLEQHLTESLLLLHSQPPILNLVLGILLKGALLLHVQPELLATFLFGALGLATALLLFQLSVEWTGSIGLASLAVFLFFANPSYYGGSNAGIGRYTFFYEFALQPLLLLVFLSAFRWLKDANRLAGVIFVFSVGAVVNTRSLFSPIVWGALMVGLVLWPHYRSHSRSTVILSCCAALLLFLWPLKNYIVFGQFVSSSIDAYNLARAYLSVPKALDDLLDRGESPPAPALLREFPHLASFDPAALTAVTAPRKLNGVPNPNNLVVLITRPETLHRAIQARRDIKSTLDRMFIMYLFSTRPMYVQPYTLTSFEGYPEVFRKYVRLYQLLLFSPVGPMVVPNRYLNVFNVFLLPALTISTLVALRVRDRNRVLLGLLILTAMFPVICACLSDGFEGNRMRHSTYPLMILLGIIVVPTIIRMARPGGKI